MSEERFRNLGEAFARDLRDRGQRLLEESTAVVSERSDVNEEVLVYARNKFNEGAESIRQSQLAKRLFDEFDQALVDAGLSVPFYQFLTRYLAEEVDRVDLSSSHPVIQEPAINPVKTAPRKEKAHWGDRRRALILGLIELNEDHTDFKYPTLKELTPVVYADKLAGPGKGRVANYRFNANKSVESFIEDLMSEDRKKNAAAILEEIRSRPEFANITDEQLAKALRREISYQELIGQNSPAITAPALIIGPHPLPSGPEESEPPQPDVEVDLGKIALPKMPERNTTLQERVAYSLMLIDPRRNGFEFENLEAVIREVYEEELDKLTGDARRKRIRELTDSAQRNINGFVFLLQKSTRQEDDQVAPLVRNFLNWVERQPYYDGFAVEDIIKVLERKMSFDEVVEAIKVVGRETNHAKKNGKKPDDENQTFQPRLNRQHKYLIVERILALDPKERQKLGILLSPEDKTRLSNIRRKIEQSVPNIAFTARGYTDTLVAKLKMALANQDLYLKHLKDGESYLIYQCLKGVRTQAQIEELIRILR